MLLEQETALCFCQNSIRLISLYHKTERQHIEKKERQKERLPNPWLRNCWECALPDEATCWMFSPHTVKGSDKSDTGRLLSTRWRSALQRVGCVFVWFFFSPFPSSVLPSLQLGWQNGHCPSYGFTGWYCGRWYWMNFKIHYEWIHIRLGRSPSFLMIRWFFFLSSSSSLAVTIKYCVLDNLA